MIKLALYRLPAPEISIPHQDPPTKTHNVCPDTAKAPVAGWAVVPAVDEAPPHLGSWKPVSYT